MARRPRPSNDDKPAKSKKLDPIIEGLVNRLPAAGAVWPDADRQTWLNLIEAAFKVVYEEGKEKAPATISQHPTPRPPGSP